MSLTTITLRGLHQHLRVGFRDLGVPVLLEEKKRNVSTSPILQGKRNFRKFHIGNKRGTRIFKEQRNAGEFPDIPIETEVRPIGFKYGDRFHIVPEMVPDFVVPDLTDCELKPYVSYRAGETYQEPFTPKALFEHVYLPKMHKDFKEGKLDENGNPLEPSTEERLTSEEAWIQARKTGSDLFSERTPRFWECLDIDLKDWKQKRAEKYGYTFHTDFMKEDYTPGDEHKETEEDKKPKIVPYIKHRRFH